MNQVLSFISWLFITVFRVSAWLVLATVLIFPAFKGVWAGYVPVVIGFGVGLALWKYGANVRRWISVGSDRWFLCWLCVWTLVAQGILIMEFRSLPTFDGLFVYRQAVEWLETGRIDPITYYAPGQIWYYGLWFLLLGPSPLLAQWVQVPLAMAIPVVVFLIGRDVGDHRKARLAAILAAVYPGTLLYILVTPYYYYLYTLMILLMAWTWIRVDQVPSRWGSALLGGLAAGWGALTKATLLVAPIQAIFFWVVAAGAWRSASKRWLAALVFCLAIVAVLTPWTLRNIAVFGQPITIATSGPLVFFSANNPESDGLYSDIPDRVRIDTPEEMLAHMAWCNEQAGEFIREQPLDFLRLVWMKFLHTWGTETTFVELINRQGEDIGWLDPALRFGIQVGWAALVLAWALGAWRRLRNNSPATPLEVVAGIFVLSKFLIYSVYEGGARHHLPAVPLLILVVTMCYMGDDTSRHCDSDNPR